ncbi:MAG TPA: hypothetical protein PLV21_11015 [Cyclobacteriaceae bacterium]|nr:hypothetical protein [Cyclobacteriaceae bacterium]HRJ82409.1 hypothetical protein [Cyclobacteriaceae bacterium]
MKQVFSLLLFSISIFSLAQADKNAAQQLRADQEQAKRASLLRTMDQGIEEMNQGMYTEADEKFVYVLNNIKGVPSDLTFYFGKNSFYLNKFKQSTDWLNKYIQLKGTTGQHYSEALELLKKAEAEVLVERSKEATKVKQVLSQSYDIDCGPTGKVICPVCKGTTVIIKKGAFGNEYKSCQYCDKHGQLTCDEYNQLVRGELKPRQN